MFAVYLSMIFNVMYCVLGLIHISLDGTAHDWCSWHGEMMNRCGCLV